MKTLIIYDNNGKIWTQVSGDYVLPSGLQYLETTIPDGKYLSSINVSVTPNVPVFFDNPIDANTILQNQIDDLKVTVNDTYDFSVIALEATATIYETVLPFLPNA